MTHSFEELTQISDSHPIIFYDGVCKFCNSWVNFLIRRDDNKVFRFASLQSEIGQTVCKQLGINQTDLSTMVLLKKGKSFTKSDVLFEVLDYLPGVYQPAHFLKVFPKFFRDFVYDMVAKIRYKIFGRKEKCEMPDPSIKEFHLDWQ